VDKGVPLRDDQLIYIRMNPRSFTPFGLGPLEVAFETVNQFLSAHRFAGKLAANAVAQYALWLNEATPTQHDRLIRWWQDEIEGTGRVPLISTQQKPEVLRFAQGTDADLRLAWQEFLIRMVANAFGLPPLMLGLEADVNQSTAAEMTDEAFRGAISPLAMLLAGHITRDLFGKCIGWREFEFVFNELNARDEETELAVQVQLLQAGVLTVNEVRAMRGLGPLSQDSAVQLTGEEAGNRE
jgi:phage portal protein BeeE